MSPGAAGVLCAVRGHGEQDVVRALGSAPTHLRVSRRCADLAELLGAADAGRGRVAVVSADLPGVDREAVRHLHGSGAWVVLLADADGRAGADSLGADVVLAPERAAEHVLEVVRRLVDEGVAPAPGPADAGAPADTGPPAPPGRLVAVWGPTGAPGRTTLAVNLAAEIAGRGGAPAGQVAALLVDADTYGGTVAQTLGLLDEAPGIAAATRTGTTGRLDGVTLAALTPQLENGLRVLTGISRPERWPELPVAGVELVWDAARELAAHVVVDCGFSLEQDEALSYDTRAPRRNGVTLSALDAADVVVVVGTGDPIGLQRLVRGLAELETVVPAVRRVVVVNRVRASASGARPEAAIRDALARYAGVTDVHLLPEDQLTCDGAVLAARTLTEHDPTGRLTRAIGALADRVVVPSQDGTARVHLAPAVPAGAD